MSFEYHFVPVSTIDGATLSTVAACFEKKIATHAIALNPSNDLANRSYYFVGPMRREWPQDFTLCLEEAQCYLCFDSATGEQRNVVLSILSHCLSKAGLVGSFEEL